MHKNKVSILFSWNVHVYYYYYSFTPIASELIPKKNRENFLNNTFSWWNHQMHFKNGIILTQGTKNVSFAQPLRTAFADLQRQGCVAWRIFWNNAWMVKFWENVLLLLTCIHKIHVEPFDISTCFISEKKFLKKGVNTVIKNYPYWWQNRQIVTDKNEGPFWYIPRKNPMCKVNKTPSVRRYLIFDVEVSLFEWLTTEARPNTL